MFIYDSVTHCKLFVCFLRKDNMNLLIFTKKDAMVQGRRYRQAGARSACHPIFICGNLLKEWYREITLEQVWELHFRLFRRFLLRVIEAFHFWMRVVCTVHEFAENLTWFKKCGLLKRYFRKSWIPPKKYEHLDLIEKSCSLIRRFDRETYR